MLPVNDTHFASALGCSHSRTVILQFSLTANAVTLNGFECPDLALFDCSIQESSQILPSSMVAAGSQLPRDQLSDKQVQRKVPGSAQDTAAFPRGQPRQNSATGHISSQPLALEEPQGNHGNDDSWRVRSLESSDASSILSNKGRLGARPVAYVGGTQYSSQVARLRANGAAMGAIRDWVNRQRQQQAERPVADRKRESLAERPFECLCDG